MVFEPIPKSQHRPIGSIISAFISTSSSPQRCRFNFKQANWKTFTDDPQQQLSRLERIPQNYDTFTDIA